jgi:hypothetical protein
MPPPLHRAAVAPPSPRRRRRLSSISAAAPPPPLTAAADVDYLSRRHLPLLPDVGPNGDVKHKTRCSADPECLTAVPQWCHSCSSRHPTSRLYVGRRVLYAAIDSILRLRAAARVVEWEIKGNGTYATKPISTLLVRSRQGSVPSTAGNQPVDRDVHISPSFFFVCLVFVWCLFFSFTFPFSS